MIKKNNPYFFLLSALLLFACSNEVQKTANQKSQKMIKLTQWEYSIDQQENWNSLVSLKNLHSIKKDTLWLRTFLPRFTRNFTHIFLGRVNFPFRMYLGGDEIFLSTDNDHLPVTNSNGLIQFLIPLPQFRAGEELLVKLYMNNVEALKSWNPILTSADKVYKDLFVSNIDDLLLTALFISITIMLMILFIFYLRTKLLFGIIIFISSIALFTLSNSLFLQLILPAPNLYYHADYISLIAATVGAFFAVEQIINKKYKWILKSIVIIHTLFLVGTIILISLTNVKYLDTLNYFMVLLSINMLIIITVILINLREGRYTAKLLLIGMSLFLVSAFTEVIIFYSEYSATVYNYSVQVLHFGALLFIVFLIWIAGRHYINSFKEKDLARQQELTAIKRENEVREQFARRLIKTQEDERNRIAMELHDSVGQKLLLIKNYLLSAIRLRTNKKYVNTLQEISDLSGETIKEVREISHNLRPRHLDQLGLTTAIETVIERFDESSEINFHFELDNIDDTMPKEDEINYYRIVQESLNNIVKHSNASEAFVTIKKRNNHLIVEIKDNGKEQDSNSNSEGIGITGMRERAKMINAELFINIRETEGTKVKLIYPIKRAAENETD